MHINSELPIIQYWHSEQPPERIRDGLASFAEVNPSLRHLVFNESSAGDFIAEHLSAREAAAFHTCAVPAMQADYFRYCAGLVLGGLYADADLRCVADVRPLIHRAEGTLFARREPSERAAALLRYPYRVGPYCDVDNSPFAFRQPGHPLLGLTVEIATAIIEKRIADGVQGVWLTAGQGIFTSMYLLDRLGSVDAFLDYVDGSALEPSASLFCELVGGHSTVATVLSGVDIRPASRETCLGVPAAPAEARRAASLDSLRRQHLQVRSSSSTTAPVTQNALRTAETKSPPSCVRSPRLHRWSRLGFRGPRLRDRSPTPSRPWGPRGRLCGVRR